MGLNALRVYGSSLPCRTGSQPRAWPSVALRSDTHPAAPGTGAHLAGVAAGVVSAGGPVLAGAGRALVHLLLAVAARVACLAVAVVCVARIHAEAPVPAQAGHVDACRGRGRRSVRPRLPSPGAASGRTPPDLRVRTPGGHTEAWVGYLAAARPPHRRRWARRSRGQSSRCGTRSGTSRWSASTGRRSCRGRSRTSAQGSGDEGAALLTPHPLAPTGSAHPAGDTHGRQRPSCPRWPVTPALPIHRNGH